MDLRSSSILFVGHRIYTFDFFEMVSKWNRWFGKKHTIKEAYFFKHTFPSMISLLLLLHYASYKKTDIIFVISVVHNPYSRIYIFIFIATNAHINLNTPYFVLLSSQSLTFSLHAKFIYVYHHHISMEWSCTLHMSTWKCIYITYRLHFQTFASTFCKFGLIFLKCSLNKVGHLGDDV